MLRPPLVFSHVLLAVAGWWFVLYLVNDNDTLA
jgi:hypothetical protein